MDYRIDAAGKKLGRLASEIALVLQGKKSPKYKPHVAGSDRVLLSNFNKLDWNQKKLKGKIYYRHTGYMGHLKEETLEQKLAKDPKKVVRDAVWHMLPKNFLNSRRIKNLIFVEHEK